MKKRYIVAIVSLLFIAGILYLRTPGQAFSHLTFERNTTFYTKSLGKQTLMIRTDEKGKTVLEILDETNTVVRTQKVPEMPLYRGSEVLDARIDDDLLLSASLYEAPESSILMRLDAEGDIRYVYKIPWMAEKLYPLSNGAFAVGATERSLVCNCGDNSWIQFYDAEGTRWHQEMIPPAIAFDVRRSSLLEHETGYTLAQTGKAANESIHFTHDGILIPQAQKADSPYPN